MFNLVIVDDEKLTRDSLAKYINWQDLGINHVFTASNGHQALSIMNREHIDILLTDVRMPKMDGVALATHVRNQFPNCKIIFISGYSDKEYLKSAIQLKVEHYIEKPLNITEIEKIISTIAKTLQNEALEKEKQEILFYNLKKTIPIIKQEITLALIDPNLDWNIFKQKYVPFYFQLKKNLQLYICCIIPDGTPSKWCTEKKLINAIYSFLEANISPDSHDFYVGQTTDNSIILMVFHTSKAIINDLMTLLQQYLFQQFHITLTIGISSEVSNYHSIQTGYGEACLAAQERFYQGGNKIITYIPKPDHVFLDTSIFETLHITFYNVSHLFAHLIKYQYKDIQNVKKHLYTLYRTMMRRTLNEDLMPYADFSAQTLDEIRELILFGIHALKTLGYDKYDTRIKNTIHYILWNYFDCNLSIKVISESIGLSPNYLSSLFKQNTGSTINDFIIQIRIEKAKNLLQTTSLRLYEICERVGINDPNYFSTLFKHVCGQTPLQYRNAYKGGIH